MNTIIAVIILILCCIIIGTGYAAFQDGKYNFPGKHMKIGGLEYRLERVKKDGKEKSYYVWVRQDMDTSTWREDPINMKLYFRIASDSDSLPEYLQEDGVKTKGQYIEKHGKV